MKRAAIYKFEDRYIIHSESTTVDGYGIASAPYLIVDLASPLEYVVESLQSAMNASKTDVIDTKSNTLLKDYLKSLGLKTHKDLYRDSICCQVYEKDDKIVFLPTINLGTREGFRHRPERKVEIVSDASKEDLCIALVEALSRCE